MNNVRAYHKSYVGHVHVRVIPTNLAAESTFNPRLFEYMLMIRVHSICIPCPIFRSFVRSFVQWSVENLSSLYLSSGFMDGSPLCASLSLSLSLSPPSLSRRRRRRNQMKIGYFKPYLDTTGLSSEASFAGPTWLAASAAVLVWTP